MWADYNWLGKQKVSKKFMMIVLDQLKSLLEILLYLLWIIPREICLTFYKMLGGRVDWSQVSFEMKSVYVDKSSA